MFDVQKTLYPDYLFAHNPFKRFRKNRYNAEVALFTKPFSLEVVLYCRINFVVI